MDLDLYLFEQLNNKFINQPVLIDRLIIAHLYDQNPRDFFPDEFYGGGIKQCYVLTPRRLLYGLVFRPDRRAGNGYWERVGCQSKKVFCRDGIVAVKHELCFYIGKPGQGFKTNWKMVEYMLQKHCCSTECTHKKGRLDEWVLCMVYEDFGPEDLSLQMDIG